MNLLLERSDQLGLVGGKIFQNGPLILDAFYHWRERNMGKNPIPNLDSNVER